jgi:outer membrane protein
MKNLYKILLVICLVPFISFADEIKIGVVDVERIVDQAKVTLSVRTQMEAKRAQFQKEINKDEEDLKKREEKLKKEQEKLSAQAFEQKLKDFKTRVAEVQRSVQMKRVSLEEAYGGALAKISDEVQKVIADIAKEKQLSLVLPTSQILFSEDKMNISDEVSKKLDAKITNMKIEIGNKG